MMDLREALWKKAEPFLFIPKEEFLRNLEAWEVRPVEVNGALGLIVASNGPEFHFQSMDTGAPFSMKVVRDVVQPIIDKHGYALTKTPKDDVRQHRFNRLIGFKVIGEDAFDIHYRIEKLRHA